MMKNQQPEIILARMMIISTITAASFLFIGGLIFLLHHASEPLGDRVFDLESGNLRDVSGILKGMFAGKDVNVIQTGALLLLLNPFLRVGFAAYMFFKEKNNLYVMISLIVLLILCISFII